MSGQFYWLFRPCVLIGQSQHPKRNPVHSAPTLLWERVGWRWDLLSADMCETREDRRHGKKRRNAMGTPATGVRKLWNGKPAFWWGSSVAAEGGSEVWDILGSNRLCSLVLWQDSDVGLLLPLLYFLSALLRFRRVTELKPWVRKSQALLLYNLSRVAKGDSALFKLFMI